MLLSKLFRRAAPLPPASPLEEKLLASLLVMAWVVEARDPYTGGHLWRVSRFARLLAQRAGLTETEVARVAIGGFLHDLGKVGIPDAILNKRDKLSDEEYAIIKTHPEVGRRMLEGHPFSSLVMDAVLLHHETPDGRGYPRGLTQEQIPVVARIVGICDAFDAMTSTRPYRAGMPIEKAMSIIRDNLGRQFDAELGGQFVALAEDAELRHVVGHSDDGIPLQSCQMCGPTLLLRRDSVAGDKVYCRSCGSEYALVAHDQTLQAIATGARGSAAQLEARPDDGLIARLAAESACMLSPTLGR